MRQLEISPLVKKVHECYSVYIIEIIKYIASGKDFYLTSNVEENPINLNDEEKEYFKQLDELYEKTDFLLANANELEKLIQEEKTISSKLKDKESINKILKRIFGYEEGFSKGKFIHLHEDKKNNRFSIQYSDKITTDIRNKDGKVVEEKNVINLFNIWGAAEFIKSLNINFCIYCNEQSLFWDDNNHHSALDHFYSQSDYPFLALTLTNLIPACSVCNSSFKGSKDVSKYILNPYEKSFDDFLEFHLREEGQEEEINKNDMEKIIERNFTIMDLKKRQKSNVDDVDAEKAEKIAEFFKIIDRYKLFSNFLNEKIKNIYTLKYCHAIMVGNMLKESLLKCPYKLSDNIINEIVTMFLSPPEFYRKKLDIDKYQFSKLIIDLCKEAGIR